MRQKNSPNYEDLSNHGTYKGQVSYRKQVFQYIFFRKGASLSLFVFDPQTDGMSLTNASDFVLEQIFKDLLHFANLSVQDLEDLMNVGTINLRDSMGQWTKVTVKVTMGTIITGDFLVTGARVTKWEDFNFTTEYLELFKLLG